MRKALALLLVAGCSLSEEIGERSGPPPGDPGDPPPVGATMWSHSFGGVGDDQINSLAVDPAGYILAGGNLTAPDAVPVGPISVGGDPLSSPGVVVSFVAKYTMGGDHVWSHPFAGPGMVWLTTVAVTSDGGVLAVGDVNGEIDFGGRTVIADEQGDAFLARLDADGNLLWLRTLGAPGPREGIESVAVDAGGDILIAGWFQDSLELPVGTLESAGAEDGFVAKLNDAGAYLWAVRFGGPEQDGANHLAAGADGSVIFSGIISDNVDFGSEGSPFVGGPAAGYGYSDGFVGSLSSDGELGWARRIGGPTHEGAYGVAGADGAAFVAISFNTTPTLTVDDGSSLTTSWGHGLAVARFSSTGDVEWMTDVDLTQGGICGFAATADGRLLLTTESIQNADLPRSPYLATLSPATGELMSRSVYPGPLTTRGLAVASDGVGGVVFAGHFENINGDLLDFGDGAHASNGRQDMFLARIVPAAGE